MVPMKGVRQNTRLPSPRLMYIPRVEEQGRMGTEHYVANVNRQVSPNALHNVRAENLSFSDPMKFCN